MPDLNQGALAPVSDEVAMGPLRVTGEIPPELNGTLIRNGPNPLSGRFAGSDVLGWWPEAAMLHGIRIAHGQALGYRNRWVRTSQWAAHHSCPATELTVDSNPNVNVIAHAQEILALAEGGTPALINTQLETLGPSKRHPAFAQGVTAHPKIDAQTQELMMFRADWAEPWLRYAVLDRFGATVLDTEIEISSPRMMHDMAITASHSILFDLNVGYDLSLLNRGYRIPICWQAEHQSRLGVIPRQGGQITWIDIAPCFIQHVVNAYDATNGQIVLDVVRYPHYFQLDSTTRSFLPNPLANLWRYTINVAQGSVKEQKLDDLNIELPRINERRTGYHNRYCYAVVQPSDLEMRGIVKYDLRTHHKTCHHLSPGDQNSEPVFVSKSNPAAEDDGWILVCVYKHQSHTSELRILDAQHLDQAPLATVDLARRVPAGFHGAWIDQEDFG